MVHVQFNEGLHEQHRAQPPARRVVAGDTTELTRTVHALLPDHAEVAGLLALMLLADARRPARTDAPGELIPLAEQDRSLWDRRAIEEGVALVTHALSQGAAGPYQLQAAIAALHDEAEAAEATDWPQILALYRVLEAVTDSPLVTLNRTIAEAMVHGANLGLDVVEKLAESGRLKGNPVSTRYERIYWRWPETPRRLSITSGLPPGEPRARPRRTTSTRRQLAWPIPALVDGRDCGVRR